MWFSGFVILPIWRVFLGLKFTLKGFELRDSLYKPQTSIEVSCQSDYGIETILQNLLQRGSENTIIYIYRERENSGDQNMCRYVFKSGLFVQAWISQYFRFIHVSV